MKRLLLLVTLALSFFSLDAARIQIIHNAPFDDASVVDVYINGEKNADTDDLNFRDATPFFTVANGSAEIIVAEAGSNGPGNGVIQTFSTTNLVESDEKAIIIHGIIDPEGGKFTNLFGYDNTLSIAEVDSEAENNQSQNYTVDIFHGVTDAPPIDITAYDENEQSTQIAKNLAYGNSTGAVMLPSGNYELRVTTPLLAGQTLLTYKLTVDDTNIGRSDVLFASGFAAPSNQPVEEKANYQLGLFAAEANGSVSELPAEFAEYAYIQFVHNSPDPELETVDIYVNGNSIDLLDDLSFRNTTEYIPVPANEEFEITVSHRDSNANQAIHTELVSPLDGNSYHVGMIQGVMGSGFDEYTVGRGIQLEIALYPTLRTPVDNTKAGVVIAHGSTDAPPLDIYEDIESAPIVDYLDYSDASSVLELDEKEYMLNVTIAGSTEEILTTLSLDLRGANGESYFIFASGFATPEDEGDGSVEPSYGLGFYIADGEGLVIELEKVEAEALAYFQFIHNSADPQFEIIDVYINGEKNEELDDFEFRRATTYIPIPINDPTITICSPNSVDVNDGQLAEFNFNTVFTEDQDYVAIATGVSPLSSYTLPENREKNVNIEVFESRREAFTDGEFDFNIHHGSPDAIVTDLSFGGLRAEDYTLGFFDYQENSGWYQLQHQSKNSIYLQVDGEGLAYNLYEMPTEDPSYNTAFIFMSGWVNPDAQQGLPEDYKFEIIAALPSGLTVPLPETYTSIVEDATYSDVYPNPATERIQLAGRDKIGTSTIRIYDMNGSLIKSMELSIGDASINISDLRAGSYIIHLINENEQRYSVFQKL